MDREKAPESENFQTLFLQMGNQITHDPGGHAPDGVAPVEPHRDLYLAAVPYRRLKNVSILLCTIIQKFSMQMRFAG